MARHKSRLSPAIGGQLKIAVEQEAGEKIDLYW